MSELTLTPESETKTELRRRRTSPLPTDFVTEWTLEQTAGTAGRSPVAPVVLVVGFDGSEPAQRALDAAAALLRDREGQLEVVYVAQDPAGSPSSQRFETSPSSPADDLERRLKARQVTWWRGETSQGGYKFSCTVPNPVRPDFSRFYEATRTDFKSAILAVLEQIDRDRQPR